MKIKLKQTESKNKNDCWNVALSKFLNIEYQDVRNDLKQFIQEDGCVDSRVIVTYVEMKKWVYSFSINTSLINIINVLKDTEAILFLKEEDEVIEHVVYYKNKTIYDDIEERQMSYYFNNFKVHACIVKIDLEV